MDKIDGLIAAPYTPMLPNGELNLDLIPEYANYLIENNIRGAFLNGTTADFVSLLADERMQLVDAWAKYRIDNLKLITHVGCTSLKRSIEFAKHSIGKVDAIASLPPYYFRPQSVDSLVDYMAEIAHAAPDLPFYYYHIPDLTNVNFNMIDFLEKAENQIPNLAGIKFTKIDLVDFALCKEFKNYKYNILFGADEILLSSLPFGVNGWVGSTYNHLGPLYTAIIKAFEAGDLEQATKLQLKSMKFVHVLASYGFTGAGKSFMKKIGLDCGPSRLPNKTLSSDDLDQIYIKLEEIGVTKHLGVVKNHVNS